MDKDILKEPAGYPNNTRTAPVWRKTYIELQEVWYAVRHLAIGGVVTGDAVRSVSLCIVPACIALLGDDDDDEARDWLNYSIEFLSTVYSPWGDNEGGWAEGAQYWMMGMAYLIDAANRLKS